MRLTIKSMIEFRLGMNLSIMDMNGWKKQSIHVPARKGKRHRMHGHRPRLKLEYGEAKGFIFRKLFPGVRRQTKPLIQPGKILHGRHEGRLEVSYFHDFKDCLTCHTSTGGTKIPRSAR